MTLLTALQSAERGSRELDEACRLISDEIASVYRHSFMGPYRRGIEAGLKAMFFAPSGPPIHYRPRSVRTWEAGHAVGLQRAQTIIILAWLIALVRAKEGAS
jgi:hypothetical protein